MSDDRDIAEELDDLAAKIDDDCDSPCWWASPVAVAAAEIRRLRDRVAELEGRRLCRDVVPVRLASGGEMKVTIMKPSEVDARTLKLYCKVRDQFAATLFDADGRELKDYEGCVPGLMPGQHYGDYLILDIDIETGQITNWVRPTAEKIREFIEGDEG